MPKSKVRQRKIKIDKRKLRDPFDMTAAHAKNPEFIVPQREIDEYYAEQLTLDFTQILSMMSPIEIKSLVDLHIAGSHIVDPRCQDVAQYNLVRQLGNLLMRHNVPIEQGELIVDQLGPVCERVNALVQVKMAEVAAKYGFDKKGAPGSKFELPGMTVHMVDSSKPEVTGALSGLANVEKELDTFFTGYLDKELLQRMPWTTTLQRAKLIAEIVVYVKDKSGSAETDKRLFEILATTAEELLEEGEIDEEAKDKIFNGLEDLIQEAGIETGTYSRMQGMKEMEKLFGPSEPGSITLSMGGGVRNPDGTWTEFGDDLNG